eukprot:RCo008531
MSSLAKIDKWDRLFAATLEQEAFGQVLEATEGYGSLVSQLRAELKEKGHVLSGEQRNAVIKLQQCFSARMNFLKNPLVKDDIGLEKMKTLKKDFRKLFTETRFPVDTSNLPVLEIPKPDVEKESDDDDDDDTGFQQETKGNLLPCPAKISSGDQVLKITIAHIGLKDALTYLEPFFTVSVRDPRGAELEQCQDTPHASSRKDRMVLFDCSVFLQTPVNQLPEDAAVFFEFKHWKPKKQKFSTRCWSLLTMPEITAHPTGGPLALEIYAKPADYLRRSFSKHSVKELFLHIKLTFIRG